MKSEYRIQSRLERQISLLLDEMESQPEMFDFKTRLSVVSTVGMYLTRQLKLGDEGESVAGNTIRKYSSAFKTNVAGRRGSQARSTPALAYTATDDDDPAAD